MGSILSSKPDYQLVKPQRDTISVAHNSASASGDTGHFYLYHTIPYLHSLSALLFLSLSLSGPLLAAAVTFHLAALNAFSGADPCIDPPANIFTPKGH